MTIRLQVVESYSLETDCSPDFDLPVPILLEYLLERSFEAGEGAKAV
jgi:hypothetical protein